MELLNTIREIILPSLTPLDKVKIRRCFIVPDYDNTDQGNIDIIVYEFLDEIPLVIAIRCFGSIEKINTYCDEILIITITRTYNNSILYDGLFNLNYSMIIIMGQIDQVDRRFNLDPTTPNCIYLGTLN